MARTKSKPNNRRNDAPALEKAPTGIVGLDEITHGGLPKGRPTLVCGGPGCGKSLMSIEFLVRGATQYNEPGVLMTFEETDEDIRKNVASLGHDLDRLIADGRLIIDHVHVDRQEIDENGEYDLEGLFIRLSYAIQTVRARRVVLDTIETLFSGLSNEAILRAELRRLFHWLKERGMTTVITAERGDGSLTRQGLEEYVSDCVILLDHRAQNHVSTRRLRVVKYRGSTHGTNEYPFLIDEAGLSVLPITSVGLDHGTSQERVPTGIDRLDAMLAGGFYRGSSTLVTGTAGTGKSSIAAHFAEATCRRGEQCLYFAFEESQAQIVRNMRSIGLRLDRHVREGRLHFFNSRPTIHGLEMHLAIMHKKVEELNPQAVIIDPISNFIAAGDALDVHAMLVRMVDYLKIRGITALFTTLTSDGEAREATNVGVSSVMDNWLLLRDIELGGERNRGMYVIKSRGTAHSNQIREFVITPEGIRLLDVYTGPEGVLTGSARLAQEAREQAAQVERQQEVERMREELARRRLAMEAQIAALQAEYESAERRFQHDIRLAQQREEHIASDRQAMARSRKSEGVAAAENGSGSSRSRT
jgi:circadian clock protein KaiC